MWFVVGTLLVSSPMILLLLLYARGKDTSSDSSNNYIHATPSSATTTKAAVVNNAHGDHGGVIKARPCEIYPNENYHNVRLIQTSLGEPSAHWSPVSCTPAPHSHGSTSPSEESYAATSAIINVDFSTHAFSSRNKNNNNDNVAQHQQQQQQQQQQPPILGFGGAFTEATALNYMSLSTDGQKAVIDLLFSTTLGLGYTLGRTHINSCDFSTASYSFDNTDNDYELHDFDMDVTHDLHVGMIDMMLAATKKVEQQQQQQSRSSSSDEENNYGLRIMASPWSPPNWMKAPTATDIIGATHAANMTGSAGPVCIRDGVGKHSRYAKSWALYISKFITAYANHGIDLFAITVQNEPEFAAPWEACSYDIISQGEFIATHLGPTLSDIHPTVKL